MIFKPLDYIWKNSRNWRKKANKIIIAYAPQFSLKEDYLSYLDSFECTGDIAYNDDGTAEVRLTK